MSDPIQGQISLIKPYLENFSGDSFFKKDKDMKEKLNKAINALNLSDISPTIELFIELIPKDKKSIRIPCLEVLCKLFSDQNLEFFLAANTSTQILHVLINILQEHKSSHYMEALKCLTAYVSSSNQQLYLHNEDLTYFLTEILTQFDTNPNVEHRKSVELLVTAYISIINIFLEQTSLDKIAISDYKITLTTLIKFMSPSLNENTLSVLLPKIHDLFFKAPQFLKDTSEYKHIAMVDIPQLFIQIAFTAPDQFYNQIFEMFREFSAMGEFIIPSFPAIIAQLITPAFESQSNLIVKAVSYLEVISSLESNVLMIVFAMCDCSSTDSYRVFEKLVHAITQCCLTLSSNATASLSCLRCLYSILASFRNFFLTAGMKGNEGTNDNERFVLEKKMTMEGCASLFNESVKKGIASMIQSELVENDLFKIGAFLKSSPLLNPSAVSEYIVKSENVEALNGFVSTFNFKNVTLDQALRDLCASFLLPGEAQQIDRVMVAVSKKFHEDNEWMSEDAAYAIAFSIIMLQTDLHNENIKRKITCEEWIKNTREVEFAREVDVSVLKDIYERVKAKPLKMKTIFTTDGNAEQMQKKSRQLLRDLMERSNKEGLPTLTRELLILVIDRLWPTLFACLSLLLSNYAINEIVHLTLDCIHQLVFFLSNFSMQKELDSIVSFLCQYSQTATGDCQTLAIKEVCALAKECGEGFGMSWTYILQLFSKIYTWGISDLAAIDESAKAAEKQSTCVNHTQEIDTVYWYANSLPGFAYVDFVKCMCNVATEELCMNPPIIFTVQKIVELMKESFDRVRFIWSQTWTLVRAQFNRTACLGHNEISMYAIDGLRQVVQACIKNKEKWSQFQNDILSPFLTIFMNNVLVDPRKLVLNIVEFVIPSIDTAWDVVAEILEAASCDQESSIIQQSFTIFNNCYNSIPQRLDLKVFLIIANYIIQTNLPAINLQSAKLLPDKCEKVTEITPMILQVIPTVLFNANNEIVTIVTDCYFLLLEKFIKSQDKIQAIAEFVMPLFAQTSPFIILSLYRSMCNKFIAQFPDDVLIPQTLIPWASSMFVEFDDYDVISVFVEETSKLSKYFMEISTSTISKVLMNESIQSSKSFNKLLEHTMNCAEENKMAKIVLLICQISIENKSLQVLSSSLQLVFKHHSENLLTDDEVADIIIKAFDMLNSLTPNKSVLKVISLIVDEIGEHGLDFLVTRKADAQRTLLGYLSNTSQDIREQIKTLALSLVNL